MVHFLYYSFPLENGHSGYTQVLGLVNHLYGFERGELEKLALIAVFRE